MRKVNTHKIFFAAFVKPFVFFVVKIKNRTKLAVNIIILSCLIFLTNNSYAQDLTNLKDAKPLTISGSLSANQVFYTVSGLDDRRDPYSFILSGSLNMSVFGLLSVPLSFTYSNHKTQYSQPFNFNQFGITPSYKWIKVYAGYNSMTFSPYTLSGHQFLGGGVELTPKGGLRISAMYGRLRKAIEPDSVNPETVPSYRRIGMGAKIGYDVKGNSFGIIIFKAYDEINSIHRAPADPTFTPKENLVLGLSTRLNIYKKISLSVEYAGSALTLDTRAQNMDPEPGTIYRYTGFLQTYKTSTAHYQAFKSNISFKEKTYSIGLGYERIDPEYQTLGAYYFTNDVENITINASKSLLGGKLNIATNVGTQRNDLDNSKTSKMNQLVSSVNISMSPNPRLNMNGSYSNFSSFTHVRSQFENINNPSPYANLDTLNFTQITQSANFNFNYQVTKPDDKNKRQSIGMNMSVQQASNRQNNKDLNTGAKFINNNLLYSYSLIKINLAFSGSVNTTYTKSLNIETVTAGPTLSVTKSFFKKKLNNTMSSSANRTYARGKQTGQVVSYRFTTSYVLLTRHNFNLSMVVLNRSSNQQQVKDFTEFTGTLGYNFSF